MNYPKNLSKTLISFYHGISGTSSAFYNRHVPLRLRIIVSPAMSKLSLKFRIFLTLLHQIQSENYIISGKRAGSDIKIAYIGKSVRLPYILRLISLDELKVTKEGMTYIWNNRQKIESLQNNVDLILAEVNPFFARKAREQGLLLVPEWVGSIMKTPSSMKEFITNGTGSLKENIRKVRKYRYSYEVSKDPEKLKFFYHRMYVPYISRRYSYLPYLYNFPSVKKLFNQGGILFVKRNEEFVAGLVLVFKDRVLRSAMSGIKDGDYKDLKKGALCALKYFTLQWAIEQNFTDIDFGLSRPFLLDGVLRFKRDWRLTLNNFEGITRFFGLKICSLNDGILNFLAGNPFIFCREGKLEGFILVNNVSPPEKNDVSFLLGHFRTKGLSKLNVLFLSECSKELKEVIRKEYPGLTLIGKDFLLSR
jgi:hypothetical protein